MSMYSPTVMPRLPANYGAAGWGSALSSALLNGLDSYTAQQRAKADTQRQQWAQQVADRNYNLEVEKTQFDQHRQQTLDAQAGEQTALARALQGVTPSDQISPTDMVDDPVTGMKIPRYTALAGTRFSRMTQLTPEYLQQVQAQRAQALAGLVSGTPPGGLVPGAGAAPASMPPASPGSAVTSTPQPGGPGAPKPTGSVSTGTPAGGTPSLGAIDPRTAALLGPDVLQGAATYALEQPARMAEFAQQQGIITGQEGIRARAQAQAQAMYREPPPANVVQLADGSYARINPRDGSFTPVTDANGQPVKGKAPAGSHPPAALVEQQQQRSALMTQIDQLLATSAPGQPAPAGSIQASPGAIGLQNRLLPHWAGALTNPSGVQLRAQLTQVGAMARQLLVKRLNNTEVKLMEPTIPDGSEASIDIARSKLTALRQMLQQQQAADDQVVKANHYDMSSPTAGTPDYASQFLQATPYSRP